MLGTADCSRWRHEMVAVDLEVPCSIAHDPLGPDLERRLLDHDEAQPVLGDQRGACARRRSAAALPV